MSDTLITRLRVSPARVCQEAAATIERLTRERDEWDAAFEQRVLAAHGTTITTLAGRLDEYAARIDSLSAELAKAREALKQARPFLRMMAHDAINPLGPLSDLLAEIDAALSPAKPDPEGKAKP
jgi:chromosome segregation ATPase